MKLELISFALCPFVHRATIMLHEKGVAFETRYVDLANKPDWFLAISPRSKVPVLVADGISIFESNVINEFLDETQPPRLLPDDPFERARQRGWVEVANDLFLTQAKMYYAKADADVDAGVAAAREVLARFEDHIRGPFFAGERFGIVDVATAPAFYRMSILEARTDIRFFDQVPSVAAWRARLVERRSIREGAPADLADMMVTRLRKEAGPLASRLTQVTA